MLAGPNGSGKSTFARQVLSGARKIDYAIPRIINPDEIARRVNPENPEAAALLAGRVAIRERDAALVAGDSFAIETTISGKREFDVIRRAKDVGYVVTMTFISMGSAHRCLARVITREREEKRSITADAVLRRYPRSLSNLAVLAPLLDRVDVYDNTERTLETVARLQRGRIESLAELVRPWVADALREPIDVFCDRAFVATKARRRLAAAKPGRLSRPIREDVHATRRGPIAGRVVATSHHHIAIATGARVFAVIEITQLDHVPAIDERVRIDIRDGRAVLRDVRGPGDRDV